MTVIAMPAIAIVTVIVIGDSDTNNNSDSKVTRISSVSTNDSFSVIKSSSEIFYVASR